MSDTAARLDILIDIQAKLDSLLKVQQGMKETREEASALGTLFRQGLGIGSGMELARRGIDLFKGAVRESVGEAFRLASQMKDVSQNLGITTDALQVLGEVVKDNGGEFETLTMAITSYRGQLAQVRNGNADASKTFRELGLSADELARLPLEQQLERLARAIMKAGNEGNAFDQAVKILGTRNAPKLMQSLRELADQGYGSLDKAMKESGRIMESETIDRLDKAQKEIEKFKRAVAIQTGEAIGFWSKMLDSFKQNPGQTYLASQLAPLYWLGIMKNDPLGRVFNKLPSENKPTTPSGPVMASDEQVALANIARRDQAIAGIQGNPVLTEIKQREMLLPILNQQVKLYKDLIAAKFPDSTNLVVKAATGQITEEELVRFKEYVELMAKLEGVSNAATGAAGGHVSAFDRIKEAYKGRNRGDVNPNAMTAGEGLTAGFMQFSNSVGSTGEQIASTISGTIGGAVSTLTDGIQGLITGTKTWGDVGRAAGSMFLQALIQLGVQLAINWAIGKVVGNEEKKQTKENTIAKGAEAGMKSIAQLGPIWGTIAFAASIAAIFALLGGFREKGGPVTAGVPYVVGEKRAEVFVPGQSGMIVPSVGEFSRTSPGLTASAAVGPSKPRMYLMRPSTEQDFEAMRRLPEWDVHVVDSVMRRRGDILNA